MKFPTWVAFLFVALIACNSAADNETAATQLPPTEITAVKLLADYEADETAAEKLYDSRTLIITGEVMSIDKKPDGSAVILLNSPQSSIGSVRCHFSAENATALANVERKGSVTVKGTCANMDSHVQVVVQDCSITSKAQAAAAFNGKITDHPNNQKAIAAISKDPAIVNTYLSEGGTLYVSITEETEDAKAKLQEVREILTKHQSTIRSLQILEVDGSKPVQPDNRSGLLLALEDW